MFSVCLKIERTYIHPGNKLWIHLQIQSKKTKTDNWYDGGKETEWDREDRSNCCHSAAGSYWTQATSLCNKLQMRRHNKAMLMRTASVRWECHPNSADVNTATLSSNVHLREWRGREEVERNNNQHLPPSCLHETFQEQHWACTHSALWSPSLLFSASFASSLTPSYPRSRLPNSL